MKKIYLISVLLALFVILLIPFILAQAFAPGTASASTSSQYCTTSDCKEIDEVWRDLQKIGTMNSLSNDVKNKFWEPITKVWMDFEEIYRKEEAKGQELQKLSVLGPPTISREKVTEILTKADSPAKDAAEYIYKLGLETNIDPAIALAFFKQESNYGIYTMGQNNDWNDNCDANNPGNIRAESNNVLFYYCSQFNGVKCSNANFCKYPTWEKGFEAWYQLIANSRLYVKAQRETVEDIVPVYCPQPDCGLDTDIYIKNIKTTIEEYHKVTTN